MRGIAFSSNDIDFVLEGFELNGDDIISQLPHQSVERFEFVERMGWEFIISKPCAPTGEAMCLLYWSLFTVSMSVFVNTLHSQC